MNAPLAEPADACCYHCGSPLPASGVRFLSIEGRERPLCCPGCEAAAGAILEYGLDRYYRLREGPAPRPELDAPATGFAAFDDERLWQHFPQDEDGSRRVSLILENVNCPACCWLIERRVGALPGVRRVAVNYTTHRADVSWDPGSLKPGDLLRAITELGYGARPYVPQAAAAAGEAERRAQLKRLAIAGLFGMQVMMLALALYFGEWRGMESAHVAFLRWTSLVLVLPIVFFSARPFFSGAVRDLRARSPGMDVPVSLGIFIAFAGSVHATWTGQGHVYYDSIAMFVFLLLGGRFLEFTVRQRFVRHLDLLHRVEPVVARRAAPGGEESVPALLLRPGDEILVRPGETVPVDGVIVEGETCTDEAILTGESTPARKRPGDRVLGGSRNAESPVRIRVERVGDETLLAAIRRLAGSAQAEKPHLAELANRIGAWFVSGVLFLAAAVAAFWLREDPAMWLPATVAVLVITCPCALALAAPTALAAATASLMRRGLLVARANAIETLARANCFVFDKTGTLTRGEPEIVRIETFADVDADTCLRIAAALEAASEHPLAHAFRRAARAAAAAGAIRNVPGEGVTGTVEGKRYWLGSARFIRRELPDAAAGQSDGAVILAGEAGPLARFFVEDALREDVAPLFGWLRSRGLATVILSGDTEERVEAAGRALGADRCLANHGPEEKAAAVRALAEAGATVCAVGDGVNDAPVLAASHVSVAMGAGTDLAKASADLVLLNSSLSALRWGIERARDTLRVMRQNAGWAIGYNLLALPLAAAGWIAPWMAAIGMSLSSLLVVANSARLLRED